jgi:hypothetical protein
LPIVGSARSQQAGARVNAEAVVDRDPASATDEEQQRGVERRNGRLA